MEKKTMITIKLNEILCAIKNMNLDELHDIQGALESEDTTIHIDVYSGLELSNVKVGGANILEDIERIWPKSPVSNPPNWAPQPVMPTYPWSPFAPKPNPFNPLNPWDITAAVLNENIESATNRMPEVFVTPFGEQNESEQMCHKINISGTNSSNYFCDKDYIEKLFRR